MVLKLKVRLDKTKIYYKKRKKKVIRNKSEFKRDKRRKFNYLRNRHKYDKLKYTHVPALKRSLKRVFYWMVLRPTLSNMFAYVYRIRLNKMRRRKKKFFTASLGMVGFSGPKKHSDIAMEKLGEFIGKKLKKRRIKRLNLVLRNRVSKRYKQFFRGFRSSKIKFKYVYILPRIAHNGCRLKKRRKL